MLHLVASNYDVGIINPGRGYVKLLLGSQAAVFQTKWLILTQLSDTDESLLLGLNQNQGQYVVLSEELLPQAEKATSR